MGKQKRFQIAALSACGGAIAGGILVKRVWLDKYHAQNERLVTAENERDLLYDWLLMQKSGRRLTEYFDKKSIERIAIFGMNRFGRMAIDELGKRAAYGVEMDNFAAVHEHLAVYRLGDDPLPEADAILLCDISKIGGKTEAIQREFSGPVVALPEVLSWMLREKEK